MCIATYDVTATVCMAYMYTGCIPVMNVLFACEFIIGSSSVKNSV